jgi:sugar phosphate isomerase/epimerase
MIMNRRQFITSTVAAAAFASTASLPGVDAKRRFKIGACDWSVGQMGDPAALEPQANWARRHPGKPRHRWQRQHLRRAERNSAKAAEKFGVEVLSLALGEMNNIPYKSDPRTIQWVSDCIDVCQAMGCGVVLLAFFHNNDLRNDKVGTDETVRRLKEVAPKAEKAGVILGIESWLSAEDHMRLIDRVGSTAVKVYYDVANSTEMGYDRRRIRWQEAGQICGPRRERRCWAVAKWTSEGPRCLDDIGYRGAMPSRRAGQQIVESYMANLKFLQSILADE